MYRRLCNAVFALTLAASLVACAEVGSRPDASVSGAVVNDEVGALPPGAVLRVTLLDVSREDVSADPIAEVEIEAPQLPAPFLLRYDSRAIDSTHTYVVQAQISAGGELLLLTTDVHAVITLGNPSQLQVDVRRAGG